MLLNFLLGNLKTTKLISQWFAFAYNEYKFNTLIYLLPHLFFLNKCGL